MKLTLVNHDYRYAAEQIMMSVFPMEKPEESSENEAKISLNEGKKFATAFCAIRYKGECATGSARVAAGELTTKLKRDSLLQTCVKLAFYRAAVKIVPKPVWGSITGIRPGTIFTKYLESGMTEAQAKREMVQFYDLSPERAGFLADTSRVSLELKASLRPNDIALYVGIPFCPTRCAYCSFVSASVGKSMALIPPFLDALRREIERTGDIVRELGLNPIALYIGGGTPTTLSAEELTQLFGWLRESFDLSNLREFSVEAGRPDTITPDKLDAMERAGVTRISVNPQSLSDDVLRAIGRSHSADMVREAYRTARERFSGEINMDTIAGLPADSAESFKATLDELISMAPENITVHTLALKKGSRITLEGSAIPDKAEVGRMLDYAAKALTEAGYRPYYLYRQKFMSGGFENIGWARDNKISPYNVLIMEELCTILAAGGGASTKLVDPERGRIERIFDYKYPKEYVEGIEKTLADKEKIAAFYQDVKR